MPQPSISEGSSPESAVDRIRKGPEISGPRTFKDEYRCFGLLLP